MSGVSPMTMQQFQSVAAVAYNAACVAAGVLPANLGQGSQLGPVINANSQQCTIVQSQIDYATANSRLLTIPPNADGTPNPEVDAWIYPFQLPRLGGSAATTTEAIGVNSPPSSPMIIPVGMVLYRSGDGVQYVVTADGDQAAYNSNAGGYPNGGYTIPADGATTNVSCTLTCLQVGSIGNCAVGAIDSIFSGPGNPAPQGIIAYGNPNPVTNGIDVETDAAYIARFQIQGGLPKYGVRAAILTAVAKIASNIIYQYGDVENPDGSYHAAYFTIVVNTANSATGPSPALIAAVDASVGAVRAGGVEYTVVGPTLVPVTVAGSITVLAAYSSTQVVAACVAAVDIYINGLGLDSLGGSTVCSWSEIVTILNGVTGVASVASVTINGGTTNLTAAFAHQFVAAATQALTA
jgi:hypothetical protein